MARTRKAGPVKTIEKSGKKDLLAMARMEALHPARGAAMKAERRRQQQQQDCSARQGGEKVDAEMESMSPGARARQRFVEAYNSVVRYGQHASCAEAFAEAKDAEAQAAAEHAADLQSQLDTVAAAAAAAAAAAGEWTAKAEQLRVKETSALTELGKAEDVLQRLEEQEASVPGSAAVKAGVGRLSKARKGNASKGH